MNPIIFDFSSFFAARFRVGQNVASTWSFHQEPPSRDAAEFVRHISGWFDEVRAFDPRNIKPFKFKKKLGHYTQASKAKAMVYLLVHVVKNHYMTLDVYGLVYWVEN